jgi:hypothetical protein
MATKKRIYAVDNNFDNDIPQLVRATSKAQAIAHVTRNVYSATVASQEIIVACLNDGGEVADAVDDEPAIPEKKVGGDE